jgi:4-hydroxybenzoate polyprenyltransferase
MRDLGLAFARFVLSAARGAAPAPQPSWLGFFREVGGALRVHFFAIPAGAALAGSAAAPSDNPTWRVALAAAAAGLGWGGGQLINDLLDIRADAVDAPDRPVVRGQLPAGPTLMVAVVVGIAVWCAVATLHPGGAWLGALAALLLLVYGAARRIPLMGNIAHAALIATATWIGAAAARPELSLIECASFAWQQGLLCGAWAALYLQANYEKDCRGDRIAGYMTLVHLMGVRASAALRGLGSGCVGWIAWTVHDSALTRGCVVVSTLLMLLSALLPVVSGSGKASLSGYRFAVHGTNLGLLSLGLGAVTPAIGLAGMLVSVLLTERAFSRTPNP